MRENLDIFIYQISDQADACGNIPIALGLELSGRSWKTDNSQHNPKDIPDIWLQN